ncbi:pseudouridine synthase, partial [bacterium]|nr:pseudouridine synthase [bacterium]
SSRVLMLHKPPGFLCTRRKSREKGHTIFDILPSDRRYFSIGRLDKDSSGLLLVTDDGELAFRLTHPRHGTRKTYLVDTDVSLSASRVRRLTKGIELEDGIARALEARAVSQHRLCIVLAEGRKRQIRRMTAALGARVTRLHRIQVGNLELGELIPGEWRELSPQEIERLTMSPSRVPAK